jgi:hypothetical protein
MNRKLILIAAGAAILLLIVVVISLGGARPQGAFRLVSTDPKKGSTPHQYTAITFTFSQTLASTSSTANHFSIRPGTPGKTTVSDKSITFTPSQTLDTAAEYTATLEDVTSLDGQTLVNVTINFKPKYTPYNQLPKDVQKRLNVDPVDVPEAYSSGVIAIAGSSLIAERGVTEIQMGLLKLGFFRYFQASKQEVRALTVSNLTKVPHVKSSTSDTLNFDVSIKDKLTYKAKLVYSDLTTVRLYLYNPSTNALIYDSQPLNQNTTGAAHD